MKIDTPVELTGFTDVVFFGKAHWKRNETYEYGYITWYDVNRMYTSMLHETMIRRIKALLRNKNVETQINGTTINFRYKDRHDQEPEKEATNKVKRVKVNLIKVDDNSTEYQYQNTFTERFDLV